MEIYSELRQTYLHIICSLTPFPREFAFLLIEHSANLTTTDSMKKTPIDYLESEEDKRALKDKFTSLQKS